MLRYGRSSLTSTPLSASFVNTSNSAGSLVAVQKNREIIMLNIDTPFDHYATIIQVREQAVRVC